MRNQTFRGKNFSNLISTTKICHDKNFSVAEPIPKSSKLLLKSTPNHVGNIYITTFYVIIRVDLINFLRRSHATRNWLTNGFPVEGVSNKLYIQSYTNKSTVYVNVVFSLDVAALWVDLYIT